MNRDPTVVGRARVSAETFAEIVNSFIEPISYKTMVCQPFEFLLMVDILFVGHLWNGVPVQFCIRVTTTTRTITSVYAISSASSSSSNACANAEFGHDESVERKSDGYQ